MADFREQLIAIAAVAVPEMEEYPLFYATGSPCPPYNHAGVLETFERFCSEFLPQCPITDARGRIIKIRKGNFPKFLNLKVTKGLPKKAGTIVGELDSGAFDESMYEWAADRIQALFWVPDVLRNPDAIFKVKKIGHLVAAEEVYVKVFDKTGSKVKLVFVDRVGRQKETILVTSYLTAPHTAIKYCWGKPLYIRPNAEAFSR